ncbi:MAG: hypothetical protein ACYS1A_19210, partial [Planctomycetota bacterium]
MLFLALSFWGELAAFGSFILLAAWWFLRGMNEIKKLLPNRARPELVNKNAVAFADGWNSILGFMLSLT